MFTYYCPDQDRPTKFFYTFIEMYEKIMGKQFVKRKTIFEDPPEKSETNILIVPMEPPVAFGEQEFEYWEELKWGLDNGMKCFIDYSWEFICCKNLEHNHHWFVFQHKQWLEDNGVKIISQSWESSKKYCAEVWDESIHNLVYSIPMFEYNVRTLSELYNADYRMLGNPTMDKKYLANFIPGEIRKYPASLMLQALKDEFGEENIFYSTVLGDYYSKWMMEWDDIDHLWHNQISWYSPRGKNLFGKVLRNIQELHQHKPFELLYGDSPRVMGEFMHHERRVPPGVYESKYSIVAECSWTSHFWTEKTWKHILAEQPFITLASEGHDTDIKQFGYEPYDDLFDYTYDKEKYPNSIVERSLWSIIDNMKRLNDNPNAFKKKSVLDKVRHNRHNLLERTNFKSFEKELERFIS